MGEIVSDHLASRNDRRERLLRVGKRREIFQGIDLGQDQIGEGTLCKATDLTFETT